MKDYTKILIFLLLLTGFGLLFYKLRWLEALRSVMRHTVDGVDEAARRRLLAERKKLMELQREHSFRYRMEQEIHYCGWKRKCPLLTAESWLLGNIVILTGSFGLVSWFTHNLFYGLCSFVFLALAEYIAMKIGKARENRSVNNNLLEFLNFLGSYSVTAGEVTGVFNQISKYVDEPLKSALDQCCYEAQTTGDSAMALLAMAEKIEHSKFKELVHNMEVSVRYCADFSALVSSSRRSVREYLRMNQERKGLLREAIINMVMLLTMSAVTLLAVDGLIAVSVWDILFFTWPGKAALLVTAAIFILFGRKVMALNQ